MLVVDHGQDFFILLRQCKNYVIDVLKIGKHFIFPFGTLRTDQVRYIGTQCALINQSLQLPYSVCFNKVMRKSKYIEKKSKEEKFVEQQERARRILETFGFAQMIDFYMAKVE
jgi:hypothetical protein